MTYEARAALVEADLSGQIKGRLLLRASRQETSLNNLIRSLTSALCSQIRTFSKGLIKLVANLSKTK